MQVDRESSAFTPPLTFEEASATNEGSPHWIPPASRPEEREQPQLLPETEPEGEGEGEGEDESIDDFEFAFWVRDPEEGGAGITADEIFSNGQIRPIYPVFSRELLLASGGDAAEEKAADEKAEKAIRLPLRRLMIEDREECSRSESTSSSSSSPPSLEELEGVPPETYCVWTPRSVPPSPGRCKKSGSTGSSLRWRLRDLVVGRSHSDGKEKFVFLAADNRELEKQKAGIPGQSPSRDATNGTGAADAAAMAEEGKKVKGKAKGARMTEVDMVTAHRLYYGRSGSGGQGSRGARRSFLPYKQDLFGFFANVHGLSRTHHPY